ncbi:MAG: hypothetical protein ACYTF8_02265 [Planctomycetota bacterium]|jgi:hypothetical protein
MKQKLGTFTEDDYGNITFRFDDGTFAKVYWVPYGEPGDGSGGEYAGSHSSRGVEHDTEYTDAELADLAYANTGRKGDIRWPEKTTMQRIWDEICGEWSTPTKADYSDEGWEVQNVYSVGNLTVTVLSTDRHFGLDIEGTAKECERFEMAWEASEHFECGSHELLHDVQAFCRELSKLGPLAALRKKDVLAMLANFVKEPQEEDSRVFWIIVDAAEETVRGLYVSYDDAADDALDDELVLRITF